VVLTIDVGTTTCKAALFDEDGGMVAHASELVRIISDGNGSQETDPRQWAQALAALCRKLVAGTSVRAVAVSGNGPTLTPVFGEPAVHGGLLLAPAANAMLWLDRRAVAEALTVSKVVGGFVDSSFLLPKALYLSHHQARVYSSTRWFLSSHEYINYLLTGEARCVLHADDALRWYWDGRVLADLGLDASKFPLMCRPKDVVGHVTALASRALGLPAGIPVFAAGPDFLVSILGCAAVAPGQTCNRSGTSDGINLCTERPFTDNRLMTYLHPVKPYHNISGIISTTGKAIGWIKQLVGLGDSPFDSLYRLMAQARAGSAGLVFLPYLCGERAPIWDPKAKGVFNGLTLDTGSAELARSVAEGVCFAIRDVIETMEELGGRVGDLRITGGPAESEFLNQLKADVTGRAVLVPAIGDAELVGSMVLARTALGDFPSLAVAAETLVAMKKRYEPDEAVKPMYDRLFKTYRATYAHLKEQWRSEG
jgi:xylulokinase